MKRSVTVKLGGQSLNLRTEDDPKYVQSLAAYLSRYIDEIKRASNTVSAHQAALLAAVRVTDELFKAQRSLTDVEGAVQSRVGEALSLINAHEAA